ncbi:MAG: hypothetical protein Q8910_15160 [Bacteroidota bacterium]|nr:hypothetical protein [Bacteroidota bacterium]
MTFNLEEAKHAEQDSLSIIELAEELPFSISNAHKNQGNDFPVSKVIVSSSSLVPDVPPQYTV